MIEEKSKLRHSLHVTNVRATTEFYGRNISIDELIILLTVTLPDKVKMLKMLKRREKGYNDDKSLKVVMNYNPQERDKKIDALENLIDEAEEVLDNINITVKVI